MFLLLIKLEADPWNSKSDPIALKKKVSPPASQPDHQPASQLTSQPGSQPTNKTVS